MQDFLVYPHPAPSSHSHSMPKVVRESHFPKRVQKYVNDDWGTVAYHIPRKSIYEKFPIEELNYNIIGINANVAGLIAEIFTAVSSPHSSTFFSSSLALITGNALAIISL